MPLTYQSVLEHGLEPTATLLTEGFTGYFVPIQMSVAGLLSMVRVESVDLTLSRVILHDDQPVGVALIGRRGWTSRLAAMSIIPAARGKGFGGIAIHQLLSEARERGDKAMVLEVVEPNTPAVRLYTNSGFETVRRLVGFSAQSKPSPSDLPIEQIDVLEAARALIAHGPTDIPWQISGESLVTSGPPSVAFRNQHSYIILTNPDAPGIGIRAIVTVLAARRQGSASALVQAVMAKYPEKTWRVSVTFPQELAGLYDKLGFEREKITQWQMTAHL